MFDKLLNGIPLHEAAAYFIQLRDFEKRADPNDVGSSQYAPPDTTGELEGAFTVPVEQLLAHMAKMVQNELKTQYAYMVYANSLRDLSHHAIAEEFESHADDETEHADWLLRRMGVLGGPISVPDIPAPPASSDPHGIIQTMVRMEQEGIQNWRILRQMVGDENPSKFKIEEYLTTEQEHLDELWQLLPHTENSPVLGQRGQGMADMALPPEPPPSAPDTSSTPPDRSKMASVHIERFHPGTLGYHGEAIKLALLQGSTKGSIIVPNVALDGTYKMAAAKQKLADMGMGAAALPETAMGKQTAAAPPPALAGAAAGQLGKVAERMRAGMKLAAEKGDAEQAAVGHSRAIANLSSGFTSDAHTRGERVGDLIGRVAGAAGGGLAGHHLAGGAGPALEIAGTLGGAALGQHLGGKAGKMVGQEADARSFQGKYGSAATFFKRALSEMSAPAGSSSTPPVAPEADAVPQPGQPGQAAAPQPAGPPQHDPATLAYLQQEQEGMAAEHEQEQAFYKQKFEQAAQELQAAQEQAQQAQQQAQELEQQVAQGAEQQQAAMQQAQQIQQAAMANAGAAHAAATQAMQQSLSAQKETIDQQQISVQMRDAVHAMRQSMMQQIQQELPPATTAEANAMAVDQAQQQQMQQQQAAMGQPAGGAPAGAPAGAEGQDNSQQPGADGTPPPANTSGQPNAQPDAGTPMQSATPGGAEGAGTSPSAGAGAQPTMAGAVPQTQAGVADQPPKVASAHDQFLGAIIGGGLGGAGTALETQTSNDHLRSKVQQLEDHERDGGGFFNALNLAQAKSRLAVAEFGENHPVAATAIGTGIGALTGAKAAPHVREIFGG